MNFQYSDPIEALTHDPSTGPAEIKSTLDSVDVVIVGSGYGACVAAERLAGLARNDVRIRIFVLERGNEYQPGSFPTTQEELPGHVRIQRPGKLKPTGYPDALFEIRNGDDLDILVANGLGGGSLINASVAATPSRPLQAPWPEFHRDLTSEYDAIRLLLDAQDSAGVEHAKYRAFKTMCDKTEFLAKPASITVTRTDDGMPRVNSVGIGQASCTDCGNCMTGCNVGAKNTLAMNLIPLAKAKGVRFFTGANVLSVEQPADKGRRWLVRLCRTRTIGTELQGDHYFIAADIVILGAGALGSTEILQRSVRQQSERPPLQLSVQLGRHFSANGDGIAMGYAQSNRVNAIGVEDYVNPQPNNPGPTITGIAQGRVTYKGEEYAVTVEDGAIPVALTNLFGELATTGATIARLGNPRLPAKLRSLRKDPLAFNRDVLDHSQLLLFMGDDGANRLLELHSPNVNFGDEPNLALWGGAAFPTALSDKEKNDRANAPLRGMNERLGGCDRGPAFGNGQFVANPLWQILPENARQAMSGRFPRERNLSVHPLGGCSMGDNVSNGVVNDRGNVFHADGELLDGLYVMDGAIFPEPVGTNPFLTIAAVARRCATALRCDLLQNGWRPTEASERTTLCGNVPAHRPALKARDHRPATIFLRERLVGQLREGPWNRASICEAGGQDGWFKPDGMILRIKTNSFDPRTFFVDPDAKLRFELTILTKRNDSHEIDEAADCWARFNGNVQLLHLDYPWYTTCQRAAAALCAYLRRRGGWGALTARSRQRDNSGAGRDWFKIFRGFVNAARMHANYREFVYVVDEDSRQGDRGDGPACHLKFTAKKQLRWRNDARRLWDALLNLDVRNFELTLGEQRYTGPVELQVDATYMLDEGLLQVDDSCSSVDSMAAVASFLAFFARSIFQTSFWEFGSHEYPEKKPCRNLDVPAISSNKESVEPERLRIDIPPRRGPPDARTIPLELHRYARAGAEPALLVHGLAQGSRIFTSPEQQPNLATFLYSAGYDVWVVDYRLSNRFKRAELPFDKAPWSIDEIGTEDMCVAVQTVYAKTGKPIHVFAHCVGAMGIQIGILRGHFNLGGGEDMLASVCFNAIHPWIMPSAPNRARSKLATFAKDWFPDSLLQPIPDTVENTTAALSLFDRLTFSLARIAETNQEHANNTIDDLTSAICDRMTGLYGRMWCHENVRALHHQWLHIVGEAPGSVYRQLYYVINKERLTDNNGENTHLIEPNILANWSRLPTLFMHGARSNVFNPQSATRSAVRLRRVLAGALGQAQPPVYLRRIPDYGHMDPILADAAGTTTFPVIRDFFRAAADWHASRNVDPNFRSDDIRDADDPPAHAIETPWTGPVLRGAWRENNVVRTRWWVELFPDNTSLYQPGTTIINGHAIPSFQPAGIAERFRWADVDLDAGGKDSDEIVTVAGATQRSRTAAIPIDKAPKPLDDLIAGLDRSPDSGRKSTRKSDHPLKSKIDATVQIPWISRMRERVLGRMNSSFNFLVGSCRYPGTPMERDRSDAVFKGMYQEAVAKHGTESNGDVAEGVDALFFVGDQIYSDAYTDAFDASQWRDRYYGQYHSAFNSPNAKKLLASVPTHFAIDDHELVDNWSGGKLDDVDVVPGDDNPLPPPAYFSRAQFDFAMQAARSYMSSGRGHRPIGKVATPPPDSALWYALDHQTEVDFPCFVMDTRSEREIRRGAAATMISGTQLENFADWLGRLKASDMRHKPKFVFAGQILAPLHRWTHQENALAVNEDGFVGYPASLDAIIKLIVDCDQHNIIFVGGDLHMSSVSRLVLRSGNKEVDAWQIVASGLYSPLPFANAQREEYRWNQQLEWQCAGNGTGFRYTSYWLSSAESHFLKVLTDKNSNCWRIRVRVYDRDGNVMKVAPIVRAIGSTCSLEAE